MKLKESSDEGIKTVNVQNDMIKQEREREQELVQEDTVSNKFEELEVAVKIENPSAIFLTEVAPKNARYKLQKSELELEGYQLFINDLRLEEFYSYTEKIQQKRTRKTKQNKGKLCTANNYIQ